MRTARVFAILLIAVQAGALAATTTVVVPAAVTAVAVCSLFIRFRVSLNTRTGLWLALAGGVLVPGRHLVFPNPKLQFQAGMEIGCYLLAVQSVMLFIKRDNDRPSIVLSGLGLVVMMCAGTQAAEGWRLNAFRGLVIAFVVLAGATFVAMQDRRPASAATKPLWWKRATLASLLLAVALVSWTTAGAVNDALDAVWTSVMNAKRIRHTGFSGSGDLDSVSSVRLQETDDVQLQVKSDQRPGYLRGQVFSRFSGYDWSSDSQYRTLPPRTAWPRNLQTHRSKGSLFGRTTPAASAWRIVSCQPTGGDYWVFAPLGTTHIIAPCDSVDVDAFDVFTTNGLPKGATYHALIPVDHPESLTFAQRDQLTRFPRRWQSDLQELAAPVFDGCTTAGEKIAAVARHFRTNYQYQLEHDWGEDIDDPLLYFLRERPPAHCEFFATGAAMLLRSVDVPCRYVTGYLVVEPVKGGQWVARGRHAHAWVEAFDDERGWVIVEATPDAGVPGSGASLGNVDGDTKGFWSEVAANIPWGWAVASGCAIAACFVLLIVLKKVTRRWKAWKRDLALQRDSMFSVLHALLDQMDKYVGRFQLERAKGETLHDFTHRVGQRAAEDPQLLGAARWYPIYASCRYDGDVDDETVAILSQRLRDAQAQNGKK